MPPPTTTTCGRRTRDRALTRPAASTLPPAGSSPPIRDLELPEPRAAVAPSQRAPGGAAERRLARPPRRTPCAVPTRPGPPAPPSPGRARPLPRHCSASAGIAGWRRPRARASGERRGREPRRAGHRSAEARPGAVDAKSATGRRRHAVSRAAVTTGPSGRGRRSAARRRRPEGTAALGTARRRQRRELAASQLAGDGIVVTTPATDRDRHAEVRPQRGPTTTLVLKDAARRPEVDALLDQLAGSARSSRRRAAAEDVTADVADVDAAGRGTAQASIAGPGAAGPGEHDRRRRRGRGRAVPRQADLESLQARQRALADQTAQATVTLRLDGADRAGATPAEAQPASWPACAPAGTRSPASWSGAHRARRAAGRSLLRARAAGAGAVWRPLARRAPHEPPHASTRRR